MLGLVLAVLALHSCAAQWMAERMAALSVDSPKPARMEVLYVRDMLPAVPPVPLPALPPAASPPPEARSAALAQAAPPVQAASAPDRAASQVPVEAPPAPVPQPVAESRPAEPPDALLEAVAEAKANAAARAASEPAADTVTVPRLEPAAPTAAAARDAVPALAAASASVAAGVAATSATAATAASAASSAMAENPRDGFDWPTSTRVTYKLTGNVRGEVHGDAQVEWIRVGTRYQVHLDLTVGLSFAPLMSRRMSSDGDVTPEGLSPRRYDQETKVGFGARQRVTVLFEPYAVVLAGGQRHERWPGVQDTASQFIQLTYLFSTRPELLRPGGSLEVPLALPRNLSRWIYDVLDEEPVYTPIGTLNAFHLKPRRAVVKGGDLSAEIWFAPQLRYLPVRIRIQQDADTFIDLVISRKPELAAP